MYVARKDRTNASALFVSLSAVGMALGPLLALPLARVPQTKIFGTFLFIFHLPEECFSRPTC